MSTFSKVTTILILLIQSTSHAGFVEVGASASYHSSTITSTDYQTNESYTGSLGYYFTESSAVEFSYTNGFQKSSSGDTIIRAYYTVYGLDFILTVGAKDAVLRPYIKAGVAQVYKEIIYQLKPNDPLPAIRSCGVAPSGGAGFRLLLSQNLAIKLGAETWTSPLNDTCLPADQQRETTYDTSYRGGISWMF